MNISREIIAISGINPNDDIEVFAEKLNEFPDNSMFVGHLPFMAKIIAHLVTGNIDSVLTAFQPGSIVCLTEDENNHWQIAWMLRPELIKN